MGVLRLAVIGDNDTVTGFRLAGVRHGHTPKDAEDAKKILLSLIEKNCGIIVITERIAHKIDETIHKIREKRRDIIVVEVPDAMGPMKERRTLEELVRKAVGITLEKT